jgi:hypothetical protein
MAAGDTALSICSDALIMLGAKPIASFSEGTDEATTADSLYPDIKNQALMTYPWAFSFKKIQLTKLVTTPVFQYKYQYQLPGDRLGPPRRVFTSPATYQRPMQDYMIMGDKLLTNEEAIYIDYQYAVQEFEMPVYFVQLLKYLLAWHFAYPITDQTDKTQYWQSVAIGAADQNGRGGYMRVAMNIDGQGQPVQTIEDFSLIDVRF